MLICLMAIEFLLSLMLHRSCSFDIPQNAIAIKTISNKITVAVFCKQEHIKRGANSDFAQDTTLNSKGRLAMSRIPHLFFFLNSRGVSGAQQTVLSTARNTARKSR